MDAAKTGQVNTPQVDMHTDQVQEKLVKMIILHGYPLHIVEQPSFVNLVRTLDPHYNIPSFNTVQGDVMGTYLKEKQRVLKLMSDIPGHVNLSLDLWTSDQTVGYVFVSGQLVGNDWKLHRCLLNVIMVPYPDSDNAFNQAVVACISDWYLDSGVFSLTLDEPFSTETVKGNLRSLLCVKNPLVINGQLVVGGCFACVLSRLSQEAIQSMEATVRKIRSSVKHIQVSNPKKLSIDIDDTHKWDTTYNMLVAAWEQKEVFACFNTCNPSYKFSLSMDEWEQVKTLCSYLKLFHDAATILTFPIRLTTNMFFQNCYKIQSELTQAAMNQDPFVSNLVRPLQAQFDKYWSNSYLVLTIAVVMDPRCKMKLVELSFQKLYGYEAAQSWIVMVNDGIHQLFNDYSTLPIILPLTDDSMKICDLLMPQLEEETTVISFGDDELFNDFDAYVSEITSLAEQTKSELDQYLEESCMPHEELDILSWWKGNNIKYPTLSKMAADVLAVPMCTVPPESVFDTKSRHVDSYRSSLPPVTLQALICTRDWLLRET